MGARLRGCTATQRSKKGSEKVLEIQEEIIYAPPLPPFLAVRHFSGEGGGGVYFEAPRGRNLIRPPPFIRPPLLEGYFQGWGGGGV